jgi:hypothetical protein
MHHDHQSEQAQKSMYGHNNREKLADISDFYIFSSFNQEILFLMKMIIE